MAAPRFLPLDPPLKVESVDCRDVGGDMLLVRASGSWAHEAPARSRPVLVVRSRGRAHRFPALPAPGPPAPGVWRAAFAVPAALRAALRVDLELELGGLVLVLPGAEVAEGTFAPAAAAAERRAEQAEQASRDQAERADEAETLAAELAVRVAQLEESLMELEEETAAGVSAEVDLVRAELERARQTAFAETRRREELEAEFGAKVRALTDEQEALLAELASVLDQRDDLRLRVRELERRREPVVVASASPALQILRRERVLAAALAPPPDLGPGAEPAAPPAPVAPGPPEPTGPAEPESTVPAEPAAPGETESARPAEPESPGPVAQPDGPVEPESAGPVAEPDVPAGPESPGPPPEASVPAPASVRRFQPGPSSTRLRSGDALRPVEPLPPRSAPSVRVPAPAPEAFDHALARLRAARPEPVADPPPAPAQRGLWERVLARLRPTRRRPVRRS